MLMNRQVCLASWIVVGLALSACSPGNTGVLPSAIRPLEPPISLPRATAVAPNPGATPMNGDMPKDPPRASSLQAEPADYEAAAPAIEAALKKLIESLGAKPTDVEVMKVEKVRWPESTFARENGATPRPDFFVQGYRMQFLVVDKAYEGRTDLTGSRIVFSPIK